MLDTDIIQQLDEDQAFAKLLAIQKELHTSTTPDSLIAIYDQDQTFHNLFNQEGNALENIDAYVTASNEGMLQDWLVYGLYGLVGTAIYAKLDRIRNICAKYANSNDPDVGNSYSLYLPSYAEYTRLIANINAIYDAFMKFAHDRNARLEPVVTALNKAGVKVKYNGDIESLVSVDWKAVAGSIIARAIFTGLMIGAGALAGGPAGAGLGLAYAGIHHVVGTQVVNGHTGALIGSEKGGHISGRGWDPNKVGKACAEMVQIIDKLDRLKFKPVFDERDPDYTAKVRFVKQAYKAYLEVVKDVGRGLASACTAGIYNKDGVGY